MCKDLFYYDSILPDPVKFNTHSPCSHNSPGHHLAQRVLIILIWNEFYAPVCPTGGSLLGSPAPLSPSSAQGRYRGRTLERSAPGTVNTTTTHWTPHKDVPITFELPQQYFRITM